MKIQSIYVDQTDTLDGPVWTITINVDSRQDGVKIYIDNLYNYDNKYSVKDEDHNVIVTDYSGSTAYIIELKDLDKEIDLSAFTVSILANSGLDDNNTIAAVGFYYDDKELYYKQVDLLLNPCSTCLNRENKERIALFMLKKDLFDYALAHTNMMDEQVQYYQDLARMLNIDLLYNTKRTKNAEICFSCCNCCCNNNCCKIC